MNNFLKDKNGDLSSTRLGFLMWVVGVLAVWVAVSVFESALQPLPESVILVIFALMSGKVVQRFGEK